MKVDESLLMEANEMLAENQERLSQVVTTEIASVSCSGCGLGCSGIVGD